MSFPPRKPALNPGRWQVQRERCRLAEDADPDQPFRDAVPIDQTVSALLNRLGVKNPRWHEELAREWPELAGPTIARHAHPGFVDEKGGLTLFVDNSGWLAEITRQHKRRLLMALQQRFGADRIRELHLRLDPEAGRPTAR